MQYETKFISATQDAQLTGKVNELEREGWEFVSLQLATSPAMEPEKQQCNYYVLMVATLRRPAK